MEDDVVRIQDEFYIRATSSRADDRTRVLKHGDLFAVFDRFGDVQPVGSGEQGLYFQGTRFLSRMELRIGGRRPFPLSSNVREDNDVLTVDLTNPDLVIDGVVRTARGALHVQRTKFLWAGVCYERITITNYDSALIETELSLRFDGDFADIFEVRGNKRPARGKKLDSSTTGNSVSLRYEGLDDVQRTLIASFEPAPELFDNQMARYPIALQPGATMNVDLRLSCMIDAAKPKLQSIDAALVSNREDLNALRARHCAVSTDNEHFDRWLLRSESDLHMLVSQTPHGPYPYAGVPWFSTVFGRDGLITAFQTLWVNPDLARTVLRLLAADQATQDDSTRDAQPGKILHEKRDGEMCALREVPFGLYYGSVDSTPLFVALAGAHAEHTGDLALARELWPHVVKALAWIETYGDADGDGFVEYARKTHGGLDQQGWKDSPDSVFYEDGRLAEPPIALCEVQAYVYCAYEAAAWLATALGEPGLAQGWSAKAQRLKQRFDEAFWDEKLQTYVLALDGHKRPCRVVSSNAGHVLWGGIARPERVNALSATLFGKSMFSGWGIRTLAAGERRYNPMSYHNGSIWPHDNAMIAAGLGRYGHRKQALAVLNGMFEASVFLDLRRLPELFCGFDQRHGEGPTLYPVACAPQAWAAGSVYMLLQACLGFTVHGDTVVFKRPVLPAYLNHLKIERLQVGAKGSVNLLLTRHPHDVGVTVMSRQGDVKVLVES